MPTVPRPVLSYGMGEAADVYATEIRQEGTRTRFRVVRKSSDRPLEILLNLPGQHNVLNALAAVAVASELGVTDAAICRALESFEGIDRRFQLYGELETPRGRVLLIDDYGHHPREVAATIQAIRAGWPGRRIVLAFQPHRYTRTRDLFEDFTHVLSQVDVLVLLEVYPAGEMPISGADGRTLSRAIRARGQVDPVFVTSVSGLPDVLSGVLDDDDVLLTLGAGDIGGVASELAIAFSLSPEFEGEGG